VEGVGHHGCEYMTGGAVVVLGPTGLNFAAGMTGGVAFVHDPEQRLDRCLNTELVARGGLSDADASALKQWLVEHRAATGSVLAARLLDAWPDTVAAFCRIAPRAAGAPSAARPVAVLARVHA
jgi:glutamate synthase (NADPH/NADH) large chain